MEGERSEELSTQARQHIDVLVKLSNRMDRVRSFRQLAARMWWTGFLAMCALGAAHSTSPVSHTPDLFDYAAWITETLGFLMWAGSWPATWTVRPRYTARLKDAARSVGRPELFIQFLEQQKQDTALSTAYLDLLGELADDRGVPVILPAAGYKDRDVWQPAVRALGKIASDRAVNALETLSRAASKEAQPKAHEARKALRHTQRVRTERGAGYGATPD